MVGNGGGDEVGFKSVKIDICRILRKTNIWDIGLKTQDS